MNIKRNAVNILASAMLATALPAGAQVLGGGLAGGGGGMLGGGLGQIGGNGNASVLGDVSPGAAFEPARERGQALRTSSRDVVTESGAKSRSKVQQSRDALQGTTAAGNAAADSANAAGPAEAAAPTGTPRSGVLDGAMAVDGQAGGTAERRAFGRTVTASGNSAAAVAADESGASFTGSPSAGASVQREVPPQAEPVAE